MTSIWYQHNTFNTDGKRVSYRLAYKRATKEQANDIIAALLADGHHIIRVAT